MSSLIDLLKKSNIIDKNFTVNDADVLYASVLG